jgi:hypothetical protein
VKSVKVNGKAMKNITAEEVILMYSELPADAKIEITTVGGWPKEPVTADYPVIPALVSEKGTKEPILADLPDSLRKPVSVLTEMQKLLKNEPASDYEMAFISAAIKAFADYQVRVSMDTGPGYYRPITPERREGINKFYQQTALSMYNGFVKRMENYAAKGDIQQRRIAELFFDVQ